MSTVVVPENMPEALLMLEGALGFLADMDSAGTPAPALAKGLRALERADSIGAVARGKMLAAFDAQDGPVADGQRTARTWLVHSTRVTRGQAGEHQAVQALAEGHPVLLAGLREAGAVSTSVALQLARWTRPIPAEVRDQAEEILVAARAGADLRALAAICAEIRYRTAPPDPDDDQDPHLDRGLSFDTTFDAARAIACDAMLVPVVTGDVDAGAVEELIGLCVRYHRIRTARAPAGGRDGADTTSTSGSAIIPAGLIGRAARQTRETAAITDILAGLEQQILATILQVVSGPGGVASFLRRNLLGQGPEQPVPAARRRPDRRYPHPPSPAGRPARSDLPVPRRLRSACRRLRTPPRPASGGRRPHQPREPEGLLLVAPPRGAPPARLDSPGPPRRHQPSDQPHGENHPQSQPATRPG